MYYYLILWYLASLIEALLYEMLSTAIGPFFTKTFNYHEVFECCWGWWFAKPRVETADIKWKFNVHWQVEFFVTWFLILKLPWITKFMNHKLHQHYAADRKLLIHGHIRGCAGLSPFIQERHSSIPTSRAGPGQEDSQMQSSMNHHRSLFFIYRWASPLSQIPSIRIWEIHKTLKPLILGLNPKNAYSHELLFFFGERTNGDDISPLWISNQFPNIVNNSRILE